MEVEIVESQSISQSQLAAWQHLFETATDVRFYHHPHWVQSIAKHLSPAHLDLAFLTIDGTLSMVVPLCGSSSEARCAHPAHDHLSLNDLLITPKLEQHTNLLLQAVRYTLVASVNNWSDWQVSNLPQHSALITALGQIDSSLYSEDVHAHATNIRTKQMHTPGIWLVNQTHYSASFDCSGDNCPPTGKLKRNLRRLRKQLNEEGDIRVETATDADTLALAFEQFLLVEASGWKGNNQHASAISEDKSLTEFYRSLLEPETSGLNPEINLLWCNDECIAAQFGLRTNNCLSLLKIGYNENFARFSPGYLLLESILDQTSKRGIKTLSLVTSPPWAERWHPNTVPVWHISYYNQSTRGMALNHLDWLKQTAKSRLKKAA